MSPAAFVDFNAMIRMLFAVRGWPTITITITITFLLLLMACGISCLQCKLPANPL